MAMEVHHSRKSSHNPVVYHSKFVHSKGRHTQAVEAVATISIGPAPSLNSHSGEGAKGANSAKTKT